MSRGRKGFRQAVLLAACLALSGCSTLGYYVQAVQGHLEVLRRSEPIAEVVARPDTPPALKSRLERVLEIRAFASRELALPDNGSYRSYADLRRPFVLWNVFAAPEFSVHPVESCFLFAGCVTYRGFYAEERARSYADSLGSEGLDTYVGGVPAYSTLGYFNDPVLNTFVNQPEPEVARLIFHELAHQVAYVSGDSAFNESFATAVEEAGLGRWLDEQGTPAQREAWRNYQVRRTAFISLIERYRQLLDRAYASGRGGLSDAPRLREVKAGLFREMRVDYEALKRDWGGFAGYDRYFNRDLNNALLAVVAVYTQWVPAFARLMQEQRGDMKAFYREVGSLARLDKAERQKRLEALLPRGAAPPAPVERG